MGTESVKIQSRLKGAAAPLALSIMLVAQPVLAQDDTDTSDDSAEATSDEPSATPIIVTGSRIRRDEFSSPAPITVVDPEIAVRQGLMDTSEMIQGSPVAAGSSQITSAISSNFVTNGGAGTQTISLRGLGAERTLVLLNGRRAGPAGTRGAVSAFDLNVLPQSIVQRVDILKDGASSIYGSDAVAGVVNLITKTDTDGIELDMFGSVPFKSGGETWSVSATWGKSWDRGHVMISGNYYRQNELARGQRSYLQCPESYVFTDETYTERADLIDPRTGKYACGSGDSSNTWGHIWTYDYSYYFSPNGSNIPGSDGVGDSSLLQYNYPGSNLGQYIPGVSPAQDPGQISVPEGWYAVGYDPASAAVVNRYHPLMNNDTIIPQTDRYTLYVDAAYELTDNIEVYTELLYNKRKNFVNSSRQVWQFGVGETNGGLVEILFDEPGFPADVGDPFAVGFGGPALFSPTAFTDQGSDYSIDIDYYRGVFGLRGDIGKSWQWDIYSQYSKSDGKYTNDRILDDSIGMQDFRFGSCEGEVTPIGGKDCVDVDWYSGRVMYGDFTPEERAFLFDTETGKTEYTQWYVEAIATGDLFELPAGAVGLAVGANFRRDEIVDTPGHITLAGNAWGSSSSGVTAGHSETKEAFGEINIPILADKPLFQSLDFTAAARITNVKAVRASDGFSDESNGNWTYKLGLDWAVNDTLRFRGTYGTSYRAPALFEQFLADEKSFLGQRDIDPCIQWGNNLAQGNISQQFADNCAADGVPANHTGQGIEANIYTGGGIGVLEPETSTAWTASMILTPSFAFAPHTRFSLAVDYFNIEVKGEIAQLGPSNVLAQCYASDFFPNDPVCDLFARVDDLSSSDPDWNSGDSNNIAYVRDSFINVNSQKNSGVDVTARVVHDFGNDTELSFQAQMTWQAEDSIALFAGTPEGSNGEAGDPIWVGDFRLQLDRGPWSLFYGLDVIGGTDDTQDWLENNGSMCRNYTTFNGPVCLKLTTDATFYHSVSVTREIGNNFQITAGVANLTDQRPPRTSNMGGDGVTHMGQGVFYSQYDLLGRRAFVNVKFKY